MIQIQLQRHFKTCGVYGILGCLPLEQANIFLCAFCSASQSKLKLQRRTASKNCAQFQSVHCRAKQVFGERLPGGPMFHFCTTRSQKEQGHFIPSPLFQQEWNEALTLVVFWLLGTILWKPPSLIPISCLAFLLFCHNWGANLKKKAKCPSFWKAPPSPPEFHKHSHADALHSFLFSKYPT